MVGSARGHGLGCPLRPPSHRPEGGEDHSAFPGCSQPRLGIWSPMGLAPPCTPVPFICPTVSCPHLEGGRARCQPGRPGGGWAQPRAHTAPCPPPGPACFPPPRPGPTWRWMKTTEPSSLQVPPWRSTCSMRRICRKRMPLRRSCVCPRRQGLGPAPQAQLAPHSRLGPPTPSRPPHSRGPAPRLRLEHRARPWGTPRSPQVTEEQTEGPSEGLCQAWNPNSAWALSPPPATPPRGSAP